mgnify:CR=1 FL=1
MEVLAKLAVPPPLQRGIEGDFVLVKNTIYYSSTRTSGKLISPKSL